MEGEKESVKGADKRKGKGREQKNMNGRKGGLPERLG